ncbi:DUF87 domain-containing protein [Microbispora sp. NPDC049125]|uniref:helicase HerA domain-containing protein n=1 Tax=Microbispora sp. NPDC049125 TaxID=3154929 RepID=UPI003467DF01
MTAEARRALEALRFNYAQVPDDVWRPSPFHVGALHRDTVQVLLNGLIEAEESADASPIGVVIRGQRGAGKTHLLGWVRQKAHEEDAYFFLVSLLDAGNFWESVLLSMLDSLSRPIMGTGSQLRELLWRLSMLTDVPQAVLRSVTGDAPLSRPDLDRFVDALRTYDREVGREVQDTARALVLRASRDLRAQDVGDAYLASAPEGEPGERAAWGLRTIEKSPQQIVRDLSWLLALTGPSVIAVDQFDALIDQTAMVTDPGMGHAQGQTRDIVRIAGGLMALREVTRRTLTVISCLPSTWVLIKSHATDTAQDRFRVTEPLKTIPDAEVGRALIEKRFTAQYGAAGFEPPYPTWPVKPSAFAEAFQYTPRQLLIRIDTHVRACLAGQGITELERLTDAPRDTTGRLPVVEDPPDILPGPLPGLSPKDPLADDFAALDARFAELRDKADVTAALDPATEDVEMPALLSAGLSAWIAEQGDAGDAFTQDPPPSTKPPLHARLRRSLREAIEDEAHWCFRAIAATNHTAALNRLRAAAVAAGLDVAVRKRRLFILRNHPWANGPRTKEVVATFEQAGGRVVQVVEEDLRILAALRDLLADNAVNLQAWLSARKPASGVKLFSEALGDAWTDPAERQSVPAPSTPPAAEQATRAAPGATSATSGTTPTATPSPAPGTTPATAPTPATTPAPAAYVAPATVAPARAAQLAEAASMTRVPPVAPAPVTPAPLARTAVGATAASPAVTPDRPAEKRRSGSTVPHLRAVPSLDEPHLTEPQPADLHSANPHAAEPPPPASPPADSPSPGTGRAPHFTIGTTLLDGTPVDLELEALRKHTAIFAGSGSGKTVLIRRLVEECALRGVSSIVLDPNNDLARLGDPWPEPPPEWGPGDADRAARYLAATDVVVWTPGKENCRPLSFQPLPDFASVLGDTDEFREAVDVAVASLTPRANLQGSTRKALLCRAVLREAVTFYGRQGGRGLKGLIAMLAELPDGLSRIDGAARFAAEIGQSLTAATVNDPLFAGGGTPVDAGVLLTPAEGRKARVSVINLAGLPSETQRQNFVNQLQMALFSWIKRHPAGDRPLGGLLVLDEAQTFAPSGAMTASTHSTLVLAAQARKYGLGLVFATQAPKGLHNRIPGNAATQFFGLLNAPAHITAATEMARAKGGAVPDVGKLRSGQFYVAVEGVTFKKVRTPLCLSHHLRSPLTTEEVVARATASRPHPPTAPPPPS